MAKKTTRYSGEDMPVSSPFAMLATQCNAVQNENDATVSPSAGDLSQTKDKSTTLKLPKIKSARLERAHRNGKTVTVIAFHGSPNENARVAWLNRAKKTLGIGGSLEGDNVVLQRDQTQRLDLCR